MKALVPFSLGFLLIFPACSSPDRIAGNVEHFADRIAEEAESVAERFERSVEDMEPYLTRDFTLASPGNLRVQTSGGNISVTGGSSNQVRVEMYVHKSSGGKNHSAKEIAEALENYEITVAQSGNTISALAENKSRNWIGNNNVSISFVVRVPHDVSGQLRTSGGNITLTNLDGKQEVKTSGGNISARGIGGDLDAHTSGGNIMLQRYRGNLDARTSGGNINLEDGSGELKIHTSGGNIRLSEITGSVNARTSGGNIIAGIDRPGHYVTLATSGGDISLTLPKNTGMDVDMRGSKVNTSFQDFRGDLRDDRVTGKVNGGGIPVDLKTSSGRVALVQR